MIYLDTNGMRVDWKVTLFVFFLRELNIFGNICVFLFLQ